MNDIIKLLLALFIIFIIGRSLLIFIIRETMKPSFPEQIALSFGLGTGTLSIIMFLMSYIGIQLNLINILVGVIPFFVYLFSQEFRIISLIPDKIKLKNLKNLKNISSFEIVLFMLILLIFLLVVTDALIQPMESGDERAFWALKANILYHDGTIYSTDFFDPFRIHPHQDYPLLIPLIESWIYIVLGHIDDRLVKIIFPLFFGSLLLVLYASQRTFSSRARSLMFTALYASIPFIVVKCIPVGDGGSGAATGYADIPLSYFYFISTIYLYKWMMDSKNKDYLTIASIFAIFLIFTKKEGFFLFISNVSFLIIFVLFEGEKKLKPRIIPLLIYSLLPLVILLPWFIFQQNLPNDSQFQFTLETIIQRLPVVVMRFLETFTNLLSWSILWVLAGVTTILTVKNTFKKPIIYLFLILFLNLISYVFMYLLTPIDLEWHMRFSLGRMLVHIAPAIVFLISTQISMGDLLPRVKLDFQR